MKKRRWRGVILGVLTGAGTVWCAQEPLNPPSPLPTGKPPAISAGAGALTRTAADLAMELGLSSQAAEMYRELLRVPGVDRASVTLALATALLEAGRPDDAEKALAELPEPHSSGWHLRSGLAALQLRKYDLVKSALTTGVKEAELPESDHAWYWFLQGAYVDIFSPQEIDRANNFYVRAETAPGIGDLARARFQLAGEETRVRRGLPSTREQLRATRETAERFPGTPVGYEAAKLYVFMLMAQDQRNEAMTFLQTLVPMIPGRETKWWDDFRLTLGLIGDRGRSFAGRRALTELLESGTDPVRQRQALQLLWEAAQTEPARGQFRAVLEKLTAPASTHRILENLLYYRAHLALVEKRADDVVAKTNELLEKFPGSPLRVHAYGLLTRLAWEQRRYRLVADNARKARAELAGAKTPREIAARAELTLVEAEARFRAGQTAGDPIDFRGAAEAYAAALRERPANVKPGDLMFQRVLAEIKAGSPEAAKVLDELEADPEFDLGNRWQAEWSLARALQTQGKTVEAFGRVTRLLTEPRGEGAAAVEPALRARLAWLQARLSFEANQPAQTLALVDGLLGSLGDIEPGLRTEIASTALVRKAEAQFRIGREASGPKAKDYETAALATLQKVRADYPMADAAIQSYLIEAEHYADSDRIQEAQQTLTRLTESTNYRNSIFIPYAYYQLALLSERLGQGKDFEEANRRIEALVELVKSDPAQAELVFAARLKQGELLRRLNQFGPAQRVYDELVTKPASTENAIIARLELAKAHDAQSAGDEAHADSARLLFAELSERVDASADVRVEAGYRLGLLLARRGKKDEAARVWWRDVITLFLPNDGKPVELGATRPYWLAQTLLDLGDLYEQQGKLQDAQNVYRLIETHRLGWGEALAKKGLERLGVPAAKE